MYVDEKKKSEWSEFPDGAKTGWGDRVKMFTAQIFRKYAHFFLIQTCLTLSQSRLSTYEY
jgi:hypothetical protein